MIGFPKNLNTKADYEYVRQHFVPELWRPKFQELLDTEKDWFFVKELTSQEEGIEDDTHKIEEQLEQDDVEAQSAEPAKVFYQFEYRVNPDCKLLQLGYTHDEVVELLQ